MPKYRAEDYHASGTEIALHKAGLTHLRVRRYGSLLVIESGPKGDSVKHARFRRVTTQYWTLEMATHRGKWEPTPLRDVLETVRDTLVNDFPWTLTPIE
jgi:hypothetical protein